MKNAVSLSLIFLFCFGCAFKSTAINNLETAISYRLGNQLHLYFSQRSELSQKVRLWLLSKEQKKVIEQMTTTLQAFDWKDSNLEETFNLFNQNYLETAFSFNQILAESIGLLDDEQQNKFFQTMEKENKKIKKEETVSRGIERMLKFCFGEITPEQNSLITQYFERAPKRERTRLERRQTSQNGIRKVFSEKLERTQTIERIKESLDLSVKIPPDPEQKKFIVSFFKKLTPLLTEQQLQHFQERQKEASELLTLLYLRER